MEEFNMPKVTPLMAASFIGWIVAQAIAFGWIKHAPSQEVLSAAATVMAVGISWAEAHLRAHRAIATATVAAATAASQPENNVPVSTNITIPPANS